MSIQSKRPDGRGHWPKGKRRNHPQVPGWEQPEQFLEHVRQFAAERGLLCALSRYAQVHHASMRRWLHVQKMPSQRRINQIRRWLAFQTQ